ncbi:hypothetical protein KDV41_21095, partial [Providencia stuartii]|uniref:hypothetical protein n=1 Tax=Providencia stuartii TaxID=588 RepID=UPI0033220C8B
ENDVVVIGVGDDPTSPQNYLILSRFDDGEVDDSIGIQTSLSEREYSNAIDKITLEKNTLKIEIKTDKIKDVRFSNILVYLNAEHFNYRTLKEYIDTIFHDSSATAIIESY